MRNDERLILYVQTATDMFFRNKGLILTLTFIGPCVANIFSEYNQQDATFLKFIYFCKTLGMFQTVFLSIILLPAASLTVSSR